METKLMMKCTSPGERLNVVQLKGVKGRRMRRRMRKKGKRRRGKKPKRKRRVKGITIGDSSVFKVYASGLFPYFPYSMLMYG